MKITITVDDVKSEFGDHLLDLTDDQAKKVLRKCKKEVLESANTAFSNKCNELIEAVLSDSSRTEEDKFNGRCNI